MFLELLYVDGTPSEQLQQRNEEIRTLFAHGTSKTELGRQYGISPRRVGQIIDEIRE
jgi:hypothetical protein